MSHLLKRATTGLRKDLLLATFTVVSFLAFVPLFTYAYFAHDLDSKVSLMNKNDQGLILLDHKDRPFFKFYQAKTTEDIPLSKVPVLTQQAVIAMEDKDFYKHPGFSIKAISRSVLADLLHQDLAYGASTITQQLVKNSLLNPRKDFMRKYQEIVLAQEIERRYSKQEILAMYLGSVYFGEGAFGIEQAAQTYFSKSAQNLDLAESTLLAGLLSAPSRFSPISGDLVGANTRQKLVLDRMVKQGYVSQKQADQASKEKLQFNTSGDDMNKLAPHFALMVRDELIKKYGEEAIAKSGFRVKTSLDLDWQKYAEQVVAQQVKNLAVNRVTNGAAVVEDPKTGEIRALVGSKDWDNDQYGKVNISTSERQPGSSFKPIVYVTAFERRLITPATTLHDQPTSFRNDIQAQNAGYNIDNKTYRIDLSDPNAFYRPQNYDHKFRGSVTVRRALANSLNVPSVEVMSKVGLMDAMDMAKRLGITTLQDPSHYGLSLVLGTANIKLLELTNVYATLANQGYKNDPTLILQIQDKMGNVIYKYSANPQKVLDEQDVFEVTSILSDNQARQELFGNALTISRPAAVKTGTTENYKDAWTLGYTPSLAVGVWVGNNDGQPMDNIAGSLGAAPIWRILMEKFLQGTQVEKFNPPSGMIPMVVCPNGGVREATSGANVDYFVSGTEPRTRCAIPTPSPTSSPKPASTAPAQTPIPNPTQQPSVTPQASSSPKDNGASREANSSNSQHRQVVYITF